jgi:hypothetical protein
MILKEVREINLQIEFSRQPQSVSMPSVQSSAPNESRNLTWATLFDETETHSNLQLADKVLPDALKVWEGTLKPFFIWEHPSDLPMPILKWIQGSLYALFNTSPVPDSKEKMMVTLHRLAFPERKEKEGLPLDEIIWRLITRRALSQGNDREAKKESSPIAFWRRTACSRSLPQMWMGKG